MLASASPQRREILARLGLEFEVVEPSVEEIAGGDPVEDVLTNARLKARAVAAGLAGASPQPSRRVTVIACDTDVVLDERILGKPESPDQARRFLESLSGRTHEVLSGLCVIERNHRPPEADPEPVADSGPATEDGERTGTESSAVTFRDLDRAAIDAYLATGEWRGRAGGYAIQGWGSGLVARVDGDISNVIGLPVPVLTRLVPGLAR